MRTTHIAFFTAAIAAIFLIPATGRCQQQGQSQSASTSSSSQTQVPQQDSLAAAARRAREQKKDAPKPAKVFDNDNIPTAGGVSTVGSAPAAASTDNPDGAAATAAATGAASATPNDEKSWRERFDKLRKKQQQDEEELSLSQRELGVLDVQAYSDPMKGMQQGLSRSDINAKTAKIEAKKKEIEADKQAISDAEDQLRRSGGDIGWAR